MAKCNGWGALKRAAIVAAVVAMGCGARTEVDPARGGETIIVAQVNGGEYVCVDALQGVGNPCPLGVPSHTCPRDVATMGEPAIGNCVPYCASAADAGAETMGVCLPTAGPPL